MPNLKSSFQKFNDEVEKTKITISGLLGLSIGGDLVVDLPTRPGYVYVRLRDNQSEVIQAYNDKVSPVFDLPVLVQRRGNGWMIAGRDSERYLDWGTSMPFLPRHGDQHSFNPEVGAGGDIVWVYSRQMMPLLASPSGTNGSPNLLVNQYMHKNDNGSWTLFGGTGTQNIAMYKPTGSTAIMALVYMNKVSGNPGILVGSGTHFSSLITGSAEITPYIPSITDPFNQIPLMAVRLVSGTSVINWEGLYDTRQWLHAVPTGTAGGGSASGVYKNPQSILFAGADGYPDEDPNNFIYQRDVEVTSQRMMLGAKGFPSGSGWQEGIQGRAKSWLIDRSNAVGLGMIGFGTGSNGFGYLAWYASRGSFDAPAPLQADDVMGRLSVGGRAGTGTWSNIRGRMSFHAAHNWTDAAQGTYFSLYTTPSGTTSTLEQFRFSDIGDFLISGTAHMQGFHLRGADIVSGSFLIGDQFGYGRWSTNPPLIREKLTANRTYYVRTDGSNGNTGLVDSAAGAFLTIQKAIDVAAGLDTVIYDVTAQVRDGTFAGDLDLKNLTGAGTMTIQGNSATPANCIVDGRFWKQTPGTIYNIKDLTCDDITTSAPAAIVSYSGALVRIYNLRFDSGWSIHLAAEGGGQIHIMSSYAIVAGAGTHMYADGGKIVNEAGGITVTLTGTPAFTTQFAYADHGGLIRIRLSQVTYSGAATGKRFSALNVSAIETFGGTSTYFPGDAQGSIDPTSSYNGLENRSRNSAQFDKTNTTLANITGLTNNVLAGRTYRFRAILYTTSNIASGIRAAIAGTATASDIIYESMVYQAGVLVAPGTSRAAALAVAVANITAVTVATVIIEGTITVNAAGTLTVQFALNTGVLTASVLVGSNFEVVDITP